MFLYMVVEYVIFTDPRGQLSIEEEVPLPKSKGYTNKVAIHCYF